MREKGLLGEGVVVCFFVFSSLFIAVSFGGSSGVDLQNAEMLTGLLFYLHPFLDS